MQFIWRSTTWFQNIWSSAILTVLLLIVVSVILELIYGQKIEQKIVESYMWIGVAVIFPIILILRKPKNVGSNT